MILGALGKDFRDNVLTKTAERRAFVLFLATVSALSALNMRRN